MTIIELRHRTTGALLAALLVAAACTPAAAPSPSASLAESPPATATSVPSEPASSPTPAPSVPGVTADTIRLGMIAALSGPVSTIGVPLSRGLDAYARWINDAGGIGGRKIDLGIEDDQYTPQNTLAAAKKLVEQDDVFAIVRPLGTATTAAILDYAIGQGVPVVGVASGSSLWSTPFKRTVFGIQPTYALEGRLMAKYAVEELKAQRIAVFFQNDAFGKEGADNFVAALKDHNVEPVAMIPYEVTETDFSAHALKLQQANPDLVFVYAIQVPASSLLKEAQKIGLQTRWLLTYVLADPILLSLAGPAAEGVYAGAWLVDPATAPEAATYRDALKKYFPEETPGGYSLSSWYVGEVIGEALKRAGSTLDRDSFIAALESLRDFTTGIAPALSYSDSDHQGIKEIAIVQARGGTWVPVTAFFGE